MAINFKGAAGRLFNIWGKGFYGIRSCNRMIGDHDLSAGGARSIGVLADRFQAEFASTNTQLVEGIYSSRDANRTALDSFKDEIVTLMTNAAIEIANDDNPLTAKTIDAALDEIIRQMKGQSESVDANTVSASVSADSGNTGDAAVVVSVKRTDGLNAEYVFAEDIVFVCDTDAQAGSGTEGRTETFTYAGEEAVDNALSYDFPAGSGTSGSLTVVDASEDSGTNLLANSDFEDFTSNVPDNWSVLVGTAGTTILRETTTVYDGSSSLEFVGDVGGTLSSIAIPFNAASGSGTTSVLQPNTRYHFCCRVRKSASLAAGVIEASLIDGSNTQVTDDQSNNVAVTIAHGSISSSDWTTFSGVLVTPKALPATLKFRLRVSTALTNGESVFVDHLSMAEAEELYDGGPCATIHSGTTATIRDDRYTATIANNYTSAIQTYADIVFGLRERGLQLPSDSGGSETIDDSTYFV